MVKIKIIATHPTHIGMVTAGDGGSMGIAMVSSLHDVFHAAVLHVIDKATHGNGKHLSHGFIHT